MQTDVTLQISIDPPALGAKWRIVFDDCETAEGHFDCDWIPIIDTNETQDDEFVYGLLEFAQGR
jgi:hypothetical protein